MYSMYRVAQKENRYRINHIKPPSEIRFLESIERAPQGGVAPKSKALPYNKKNVLSRIKV